VDLTAHATDATAEPVGKTIVVSFMDADATVNIVIAVGLAYRLSRALERAAREAANIAIARSTT